MINLSSSSNHNLYLLTWQKQIYVLYMYSEMFGMIFYIQYTMYNTTSMIEVVT